MFNSFDLLFEKEEEEEDDEVGDESGYFAPCNFGTGFVLFSFVVFLFISSLGLDLGDLGLIPKPENSIQINDLGSGFLFFLAFSIVNNKLALQCLDWKKLGCPAESTM